MEPRIYTWQTCIVSVMFHINLETFAFKFHSHLASSLDEISSSLISFFQIFWNEFISKTIFYCLDRLQSPLADFNFLWISLSIPDYAIGLWICDNFCINVSAVHKFQGYFWNTSLQVLNRQLPALSFQHIMSIMWSMQLDLT